MILETSLYHRLSKATEDFRTAGAVLRELDDDCLAGLDDLGSA